MDIPDKINTEWVDRLDSTIGDINDKYTRLIKVSPNKAVKLHKEIIQYSSQPGKYLTNNLIIGDYFRYLYKLGEVENDQRRRATDRIWWLKVYTTRNIINYEVDKFTCYYLNGVKDRHFLREELQLTKL